MKYQFKVGDKVNCINVDNPKYKNVIGKVISADKLLIVVDIKFVGVKESRIIYCYPEQLRLAYQNADEHIICKKIK